MMHNNDRYRDLKLFLALALAGIVAALNHVHIPYTQVLIDGRWAFGFMGFALLRRWWAALALAALLSYPYGMPDIPLWIGFGGNMLYAVPALLTLRPLSRWMLRRWGTGWRSGLGWLALVLLCYQAFTTPAVWGVSALLEKRSAMAGILEGWRAQPFLVESLLVALFSTAALVAALAVAQLREQQRRLEHINRVMLGIRNVNQLIVKEDDPRRLIERACVNLTETMGYHNAWIALLGGAAARALGLPETEPVAAAAAAGFDGGFARLRARLDRGTFPDCMRRALESGDALVVDDPAADCPDCPLHGEYGGRAGLTRRLDFDGVVYGILTTSVPGDYAQDAEEQDLFNEVAGDLAFALHKIVTARQLAESRQHLSFVIEGSGAGTWAWNIQTNATVFSAQWATMLGYTIEELTPYDYATWERMVHPADLERARAALAACVAGGTADYSCEFRMKHKDGRWVWILDRGRVMTRDEEGKPLAMFGTHTDITEMKQAEASLKRERAMLARTEAVAHVGSWEWEAAGDKVAWSEELFRIFGLEPAEQAPPFAAHQAFYVPEDRARLLQAVEACLRDGVPYDLEVRVTRSDGEVRHCVARGLPEREADGAVKRLYGSLQDITEIRRAEGRIALLGRMLDDAPACITIHDTDGRFVFANAETIALHGYDSLDEFLQVNLHELDVPESEALLAERFRKIAEAGEARFEVKHYRKDNSTFPLEVLAKQITWEGRPAILSIAADITERKRAEESLLESERRFQRMLEVVPDMISIHSPDMDILYSNWQGFAAVPKDKQLLNTKCYRTYRGLDKICPDCRAGSVMETRKPFQAEVQLPDGTWVDLRAIPLLDKNHNVEMFMEWVRDITVHKQAEEALRRSEERFRRAIAEAPFPAMIHAEDGEVLMLNASWTRVTGYRHDEIPTIAAWAEKAYGARQGTMRAVIAGTYAAEGHMDEGDFEIRCRDGVTRIWTFRSTPLDADEQGRRLVLSMAVDITEQVYAREKRERLAAQVAAQARQLQAILDTVPQGVLLLDDAGRILHANRVAEKDLAVLAGVQAGDALTRLGDRPLVELLTSPTVKGLWHEVQAGGCTFEVIARPVEQGLAPERWVLVINDATRERDVQAQLQHQERLAAVGQLAGGIAHDFNNIMAVIILYAGMVARADGLTEPEREKIAIINQQGWHATRLIQQILDFSRQAVLEQQSLDLLPLLKEHVKLLARTLPEHIDITLAHGEEACVVSADLTRVQQMLMNLALNARDAMRDGGSLRIGLDKIEVQPGASPLLPEMAAGEWVQLTVADTGTGIAPDVLPRIFDPFFTTKAPGEGSGLGLAQVEGIVGQHGGRIGVTTALGQGTTFTIYLPALTACPVEPPTPDVSSMPQGQGEVVLVVEDQAAVRAALVDVLEQLNYQALEAANGEQALAVMQARGAQVAVVVSDVVMPVMGGVRLLHALRQQGWETPVILLTGHVVGEDFDALRAQGLHAWLPKPPDLEQLTRAIAGALGK